MPIQLTWNDTNASPANEDSIEVYRSTSPMDTGNMPAALDTLAADSTGYNDSSAVDGETYYYRVAAVRSGVRAYSDEIQITASDATIPTAGLTIWYKVDDESGGSLPDSAGGDDPGTLVGGVTTTTGVLGGSALVFDGTDGYVDTGFKTDGGSYSLSLWVTVDELLETQALYAETDTTSNSTGSLLWADAVNYRLGFGHFTGASGVWEPAVYDFTGWEGAMMHLLAVRENGVAHRLYLNGELVDEVACSDVTALSTFTGKLGGNPDNANGRYLAGMIGRDVRFYDDTVLGADDAQALYLEHAGAVTFPLDENFTFTDEGDDFTPWTATAGSPSSNGSEIVLPNSATSASAERNITLPPDSSDFIIYIKMRAGQVSGEYTYLQIQDGANNQCSFIMNYNWTTTTAELGTISASLDGGNQRVVLETGADTQNGREYAIHVDRDRGHISFYRVTSSGWQLKSSVAFFAAFATVDNLLFAQGSTGGNHEAALDFFSIARPNFISIGDSICAGHTGFDPDPDFYAGVDDVANSWQGNFQYAGLRNNLVINKGVGGETSAQILARVAEATAHGARYFFLHASTNDYGTGISQTDRTTNIQDTVDAIKARNGRCVLLNAIYPNADHANNPANADYYKDWWDNYRSGLTDVYQEVDIMQAVIDTGTGYLDTAYAEADGIHPNAAGYQQIGSYLETEFSHVA